MTGSLVVLGFMLHYVGNRLMESAFARTHLHSLYLVALVILTVFALSATGNELWGGGIVLVIFFAQRRLLGWVYSLTYVVVCVVSLLLWAYVYYLLIPIPIAMGVVGVAMIFGERR